MKNKKILNIIILVIVAIAFGVLGYFIPHPQSSHHKGKGTVGGSTKNNKGSKVKHVATTYMQGGITSVSGNILNVGGTNIKVTKGTKIYNQGTLENINSLKTGITVSVIGSHTKNGFLARFIIVT